MSQRRSPPPCAAVPLSPSRGSSLLPNGVYPMLGWSLLVFFLLIGFGASATDACGYCSDDSFRDGRAGSAYSCFPSLVGFSPREDVNWHIVEFGARARCMSTERRPGDVAVFKMVNGGAVPCSSAGSMNGLGSDGDNEKMLTETLAPGAWMIILSLSEHAKNTDLGFRYVSSLTKVERSAFYEGLQLSTECNHSLIDKKYFKVGGSKLSLQWLDVRSQEQSEMYTHKTLPNLDTSFCEEGKDLGTDWKMWRFELDGRCKISPMKSKLLEADELICTNWRFLGTMFETFINKEHELLFPVFPVGIHLSKWIFVPNPSQQPVMMLFVLNSGEFVSHSKPTDKIDEHALSHRFIEIKILTTRRRFSTFDSATNEAFVNPSEIVLLGPDLFYPSNKCMRKSTALIWHSLLLDGECFPVLAFDSPKLSIVLEPLWKPNFSYNLPISTSSVDLLSYVANTSSFCSDCMPKEIFAKHTGELQLQVKKVKTSGADCILDVSTVHECNGLILEPEESTRFLVSYEEDFSTAIVCRDFEQALATGVFITPIEASIPVYLLYSYVLLQWTVALFICATVCMLMLLLICIIPNSFLLDSKEYYNEVDNTMNDLNKARKIHFHHHSGKFSRSSGGDENTQDGFVNRYHICKSVMLDQPERTQLQKKICHQKEIAFSSPTLTAKPIKGFNKCSMSEDSESGNSSSGFVKEKRRRKRRSAITGLAAKLDASSSQSENSTPSSPSSSNASIPKAAAPCSPERVDSSFDFLSSEQKHQKRHDSEDTIKARVSQTEKNCTVARTMPSQIQSPNCPHSSGKSNTLLPLVKFSEYGSHEPRLAAQTVLPRCCPVAPSVRAPGPKRSKDKNMRTEEKNGITNDATYDIWGNYFSTNFSCLKKDLATKMVGISEGGSQSFFTRDPHSLVAKQGG